MPITPFLAGQAFDPETIENMSAALVEACDALHLKVVDDPATRFVAEKIIGWAQRGIRDPDILWKLTVNVERSHPSPPTSDNQRGSEITASNVRFGSLADIVTVDYDVCFAPEGGHRSCRAVSMLFRQWQKLMPLGPLPLP
jgi:hypothetical protein